MKREPDIHGRGGDIVLYRTKDGRIPLDVRLEMETIWLNLNRIAALFDRAKSVISRHLSKIIISNELESDSVVAYYATVAAIRLTEKTLVSLMLLIAGSRPSKRDAIFNVVVNLINRENI